jgi:hypothetical protein
LKSPGAKPWANCPARRSAALALMITSSVPPTSQGRIRRCYTDTGLVKGSLHNRIRGCDASMTHGVWPFGMLHAVEDGDASGCIS